MDNLNYIKLFEEYNFEEDEYISREDAIFSLTEEDIQDFFLPITDKGFKVEIKKGYVDKLNNYESLGDIPCDKKSITSAIVRNSIRGAYYININEKIEDDEDNEEEHGHRLKYRSQDAVTFKFLMDEILQISKRVEYIEWEPSDFITIFIVCNKLDNKKNKKKFLNNQYKDELNNIIYRKVDRIRTRVTEEWTKSFKDAMITRELKDNHFYFFFKPVSKAVLNLNMKKLYGLGGLNRINSIEVKEIEEFKKENPDIMIPERTAFIIDLDFDYESISIESKKDVKREFIYRNY